MGLLKMYISEDYFLAINIILKQAYFSRWLDSNYNLHKNKLVYSDNLEDINTQLFFYGYKIIEQSKRQYLHTVYYDLIAI